jgi:hypothetical protein
MTWTTVILIWLALQFPLWMLVGRILALNSEGDDR